MRYKYIALLALAIMLVGVMGIYSGESDSDGNNDIVKPVTVTVKLNYYVANRALRPGMIVTDTDFTQKTLEVNQTAIPDWQEKAISEQEFANLLNGNGVMLQEMTLDSVLSQGMVTNLPAKIDNELIAIPLSVSLESVQNPKISNAGFVDIYLISNDNKIYREDIYKRGSSGKEYKDTRVKKFASNVWVVKDPSSQAAKKSSSTVSIIDSKEVIEQNVEKSSFREDGLSRKMIYGWFKREDIDTVIQAQVLGSFFVSPANVTTLSENISELFIGSREVTPADIVSGAPLAERKSKVVEIRGANNASKNN
ncbi:hypothetical protein FHU10_1836 [Serratia fonticola]|jgi:hypothetical protein|uniref:Uncharacterized protein n=1 Tax=Serratia fonticola TaxID=47917 RepID=A0A542BHW7_SERFO|nr:hypothetical protein [Serratia fonticola]TQI78168.1 hypothetical protein FHU09_0615 [Serratia fonticola]TQI94834.1 hypothetical protein FHU11_0177 [Serratia fonticola]TVZ69332.1 hypothetical protein FHU10_1836 [Serratia fonticola]